MIKVLNDHAHLLRKMVNEHPEQTVGASKDLLLIMAEDLEGIARTATLPEGLPAVTDEPGAPQKPLYTPQPGTITPENAQAPTGGASAAQIPPGTPPPVVPPAAEKAPGFHPAPARKQTATLRDGKGTGNRARKS